MKLAYNITDLSTNWAIIYLFIYHIKLSLVRVIKVGGIFLYSRGMSKDDELRQ
jgi:hypothetical protein